MGLLSLIMLGSAGFYLFNHAGVVEIFQSLHYPPYLVYPLAAAKILGIIPIWARKSQTLTEWAYAAFFFELLLAASVFSGANGFTNFWIIGARESFVLLSQHAGPKPCNLIARIYYDFFS